MSNVHIKVTAPDLRTDNTPLPLNELATYRAETKAHDATEWSPLGDPRNVNTLEFDQTGVPDGEFDYRVFWTDTDGNEGPASDVFTLDVSTTPAKAPPQGGAISAAVVS